MQQQLIQLGNGAHALATQILGNTDDAADAVHDLTGSAAELLAIGTAVMIEPNA